MEDIRQGDVDALDRCFDAGLLDGSLQHESSTTENNLLHFARLAQVGLQVLMHSLHCEAPGSQGKDTEIKVGHRSLSLNAVNI